MRAEKLTEEDIKSFGKRASEYFESGFHCAEAVTAAVLDAFDENHSQALAHATAFGGGMGRTFNEACGALSGGLIAIGHLYGRQNSGEDWDIPANLGAQYREKFIEIYQTAHCGTLRDRFGEELQMQECSILINKTTIELLRILEKHSENSNLHKCD